MAVENDRDLFGEPILSQAKKKGQPKGYAHPPGTGPAAETCGTCGHCYKFGNYFKCDLVKVTNGPGTDIRKK